MAKQKKEDAAEEAYKIHRVLLSAVKTNPLNPRVIQDEDFRALVKSIKQDGFMLAIRFLVVDANGIVMGGNQRLKACQEAGLEHVYVVYASDLTEEQIKEFVIKDNLHFGRWDKQMLSTHYSDREMVDIGMNLLDIAIPRLETIGDIEPEIDQGDLDERKEAYDNNPIKQIVVYFPADLYEKVVDSMERIKLHMGVKENPEVLLQLITYWKNNYAA